MWFRNLKLRFKLILFGSMTVFLFGIVFIIAFPLMQYRHFISAAQERMNVMDIVIRNNITSLKNVPIDTILNTLNGLDHLNFITVYDSNKIQIANLRHRNFEKFDSLHSNFINKILSSVKDNAVQNDTKYIILDSFYILFSEIRNNDKIVGYLLINFDISNIDEAIAKSRWLAILVTLLFIIISTLISYTFSYIIVKPIERIMTFFKAMADGKGDLTRRLYIGSNDEIGILANEFNRFIEAQSDMIYEIKKAIEIINAQIQMIEELSNKNNYLINDLTVSLDQIQSAVTQLEYCADLNVESTKNATTQSEKSILLSTENQKAVEKSITEMTNIKSQVYQLESDMTTLHKRSQQIQNISDLLKDISDRTTILALNTSIEANKAGEHGSGFLIIADEIHRLADQSLNSLGDINRLTIDLQKSLDQSYKITLSTSKEVENGMESIEKTGGQITESLSSVNNNLAHIKEVSDMASEQKMRVEEIVDNITNSVSNISHIKLSTDKTLNSVQEQKKRIDDLTELMQNFKIMS